MADLEFEPPSFSLGLDLDDEPEPQSSSFNRPADPCTSSSFEKFRTVEVDGGDDFGYSAGVSHRKASDQPLVLKRLRKGTADPPKSEERVVGLGDSCLVDIEDDEIEDFSPDDVWLRGNFTNHSVCSSSKSSLNGTGILTSQSGSFKRSTNGRMVSSASVPAKAETENNLNFPNFPKLATSPLRKFHLVDLVSDSDDTSTSEDSGKEVGCSNFQLNRSQSTNSSFLGSTRSSDNNRRTDLWKNLCSEKSFHIPTPAFDEICDEIYESGKYKNQSAKNSMASNISRMSDVSSAPPSHRYFLHEDLRIQKLVRDRLPYFFPLGAAQDGGQNQENAPFIDYMSQFSNEGNSKQTPKRKTDNVVASSKRAKKNVKESNINMPLDSADWVNPKTSGGIPKDAGQRRVHAASKSSGYWYTSSSGQKVYVSNSGQKSTGTAAYRDYKKESGKGFKSTKKKAVIKKKTGAKEKSC